MTRIWRNDMSGSFEHGCPGRLVFIVSPIVQGMSRDSLAASFHQTRVAIETRRAAPIQQLHDSPGQELHKVPKLADRRGAYDL